MLALVTRRNCADYSHPSGAGEGVKSKPDPANPLISGGLGSTICIPSAAGPQTQAGLHICAPRV